MNAPIDHKQVVEFPIVDEELLRSLPPVLRAVVKALGFARAFNFLSEHGGISHNIPEYKCTRLGISPEELVRLRIVLMPHMDAQSRVWLPKPDKLFIITRDAQINKEAATQSISKQARTYNLSDRQILNIRAALTKDERMAESAIRRSLSFNQDELTLLKRLAEEKILVSTSSVIYSKILNKLNRAILDRGHGQGKHQLTQFDLF